MYKKLTYAKLFPAAQIGIGLLFFLQIILLSIESGFHLSLGETGIVISFTISGLIWLIAGVGLLRRTIWGWRAAVTLYTVCFIYQGWLFVRTIQMIDSVQTHALDRFMYSRLCNAILFLAMLLLLFFTKRRLISETATNAQEDSSL